jgi:Ca2+-binding RTX toxin-like protein
MSDSQGLGLGFAVGDASIFGIGQLADVFGIVKAKLQQVASNDGLFAAVFGDKANTDEVQSVRGQWAIGDFSQLPSVQVISAADMNGADGAYASSTQKIYLSDAAFGMGAAVTLIEEIGHFLDAKVGQDTVGDEGERFASSVFELQLSADQLSRINNEDDRGFVTVDGESVSVEQALINGNNANNTLNGTNSDDVINGYNGNDTIYANGGNDLVYGGGNDDRLWGGTGNDKLWGEDGADELRGDDGNDELRGGNQDDRLWGGNQDDRLWGEEGNDQLVGDSGNDELYGGNGDDRVWGSSGNDRLWGERGNDQLTGDDGSDVLNGYGFADNERDTLIGGTGADRFVLGDANSIFYAKNGNSDAAVIADFNRGEGDVIALKKLAFNNSSGDRSYGYRLVTVGVNTEVRVDNTNELVGILQNRTGVSLLQGFSFEGTSALRTGQANTDVDGDGKSDAIVVNDNGVTVKRSTGSSFAAHETWIGSAYYGSRGTYFADVDGDGKADAIVVNDNGVTVKRSTGSSFAAHETWIGSAYYGSRGTFVGNTNNQASGYYSELSSLTDNDWDVQSGDDNQFEQNSIYGGGDQRWRTDDRIEHIYSDLSASIFGSRRTMNTGYAFDKSYSDWRKERNIPNAFHSGIDIAAETGKDDVKVLFRGVVVQSYHDYNSKTKFDNGHWMAIDELDAAGNKTGRRWWYGHMQSPAGGPKSWIGKTIEAGTILGKAGMGHLHLAVQNVSGSIGNGTSAKDVQNRSMSPIQAFWKAKNGIKEAKIWN